MTAKRTGVLAPEDLDIFCVFLARHGYVRTSSPHKAVWEVARLRKAQAGPGDIPVMIFNKATGEHLSVYGCAAELLEEFHRMMHG